MQMITKVEKYSQILFITAAIAAVLLFGGKAIAYPRAVQETMLVGPWELAVQVGMDGASLAFPVNVPDYNAVSALNYTFPVMGTPISIKLKQYLPDLGWDTNIVKRPNGGIVASLQVKAADLEQKVWLVSDDPERQAISSPVGGVAIKRLYDSGTAEKLAGRMADGSAIGIISVWIEDANVPLEFVIEKGEKITLPGSQYCLKILEYMPHYSIDIGTKEVINRSENPVNPAIKIGIDNGKDKREQWLWSKFATSPHTENKLPFRVTFTDFDLGGKEGRYIIAVLPESKSWLFLFKDGKNQAATDILGKSFVFTKEGYSFVIEDVVSQAGIETSWKNNSENLQHPAIIAFIGYGDMMQDIVLEYNKPYHYNAESGTIVLLYRQRAKPSGDSM
ncbi:MAG: hypothetical protein PHF37_01275 [Phycisphaerae bacterium]|nr:hypothetical protein [Phycisphaerae bacterium]